MQRLTISNGYKEETIFEKVLFIPLPARVRHLYLVIQYPDGTEESVKFATQQSYKSAGNQNMFVNLSESKYRGVRASKIQEVVNRLEKEGYRVSTPEMALFMDVKIDRLILEKH